MAGVRDPAFWKRFSVAVHMDEEQQGEKRGAQLKDQYVLHHQPEETSTSGLARYPNQTSFANTSRRDSWLARQNSKKKNRTMVCWCFWIFFLVFVAAFVAVIIWLVESGVLDGVKLGGQSNDNQAQDGKSS